MNFKTITWRSRLIGTSWLALGSLAFSGCALNNGSMQNGSMFSANQFGPATTSLTEPIISQGTQDNVKPPQLDGGQNSKVVVRAQDTTPSSPTPVQPGVDPYATKVGAPQFVPPGQPIYGPTTTYPQQESGNSVIPSIPNLYPNPGDPNAPNSLVPDYFADIDIIAQEAEHR